MNEEISCGHIAVSSPSKKEAARFFTGVLGMDAVREFIIPMQLTEKIFQVKESIDVMVFDNGIMQMEVFIYHDMGLRTFDHVCLMIPNRRAFMASCRKEGLEPFEVLKGDRTLLFVRDFAGNLYEIKER